MKKIFPGLVFLYLVVQIFFGPFRDWAKTQDFRYAFDFFFELSPALNYFSGLILFFGFSLGSYLILKKFYPKKDFLKLGLSIVVLIIFIISIRYLIQEVIFFHLFDSKNYFKDPGAIKYFFDNLYQVVVYSSLGFVFYFLNYSRESEQAMQVLAVEKREMELALLRSQINPHFLFNQLNSIYSLVNSQSEKSLPTISRLSDFLRYALYEKADKVKLKDELDSVENFVGLQKLRLASDNTIQFNVSNVDLNWMIHPYIFLPFVENAIKHGEVKNLDNPILIQVDSTSNELLFTCQNKIAHYQKDKNGGIGLNSIKRRLELLYPNNHTLRIKETEDAYIVHMKIDMSS